uniref:Uncharacterized protein n=1 Tax=Sinocyclocheilus anshuiensis TaxID=1608454 RepID=A0A671QSM9_9TELE
MSFSSLTLRTTVVRSVRGGWPRSRAVIVKRSCETSSRSIRCRTLSQPDASSNLRRRRTDSVAAPNTYSTCPFTPMSRYVVINVFQKALVLVKYHLTLRQLLSVNPLAACSKLSSDVVNFEVFRARFQSERDITSPNPRGGQPQV